LEGIEKNKGKEREGRDEPEGNDATTEQNNEDEKSRQCVLGLDAEGPNPEFDKQRIPEERCTTKEQHEAGACNSTTNQLQKNPQKVEEENQAVEEACNSNEHSQEKESWNKRMAEFAAVFENGHKFANELAAVFEKGLRVIKQD